MPWVRVTGRVIDTGTYRRYAAALAKTDTIIENEKKERVANATTPATALLEVADDPQNTQENTSSSNARTPNTARMSSKRKAVASLKRRDSVVAVNAEKDDDDDDDDDDDHEWRTRMIFHDLLHEFYPRYGVSVRKEFGKRFKASKADGKLTAFPLPGTMAVSFR